MEEKKLISLQEASKRLGVKPITLRKWDREGKLSSVRVGTRGDRKYTESTIEIFLEKSQQKKEWQEYIRSGASYMQVARPFEAFTKGMKNYLETSSNHLMAYIEGDTLYWYYDKNDLYETGKKIIEKLLSYRKFEDEFFNLWDEKSKEILKFIQNNPKEKISIMNKDELLHLYKNFSDLVYNWYSLSMSIDGTDETLMIDVTQRLKKILKEKLKENYTEKEFINSYNILTSPKKLSYLNDEKLLTLELVRDLEIGELKKDSLEFKERIQKILDKFWWTDLGWSRQKPKNFQEIVEGVNKIIKSNQNVQEEIEEINTYEKRTKYLKEEIENKYGFLEDKKLKEWLKILERLYTYHDYRKEIQIKYNFYEYILLDEISKTTKISSSILEWCHPNEIINLLKSEKFDEHEVNQRRMNFLCIFTNGKFKIFSGKQAKKEHKKELEFDLEETRDIQGTSACLGKVVGEAFVAITVNSASKIKEGQILITGMTTPDYLPAMKKAVAFVTDEGGITCHAAIVSRELKKPCIVGTRNATKLIKTGDIIEVAANHGVVKILEKK